ncbi:MAG: FAD-dependent oxidoreductase [Gammaproteobacteria bacterium]|nr:FAD-dependent oxidoreductase [Gammaproteobacteria bacterium]
MESHARVVVIGGGVVGCSILFHLARGGWKDVVLLERSELTSVSSWHAAGMFHTISADPNLSALQHYTIELYNELEELSGQSIGLHTTGQVYLASTPDRLDYLKRERSKARYTNLPQEFITLQEAAELNPLIDPKKYLGALFDPVDGHIDPSGVTHAYAKAARKFGATIHRNTPVLETNARTDGQWEVVTPSGTIVAERVVNAAGLWAREVGHLAGIELPVQPMEHHYLITEEIPEIAAHGKEICGGVDYEANIYFRQEHNGLLLGTYESSGTPWMVGGTPQDFGHELLPNDLDRVADRLELAFDRMPALERAGIKTIINGPFTFGPDGSPLVGPVPGLRNYWAAVGVMAGFCQGGGVGKVVAEWMIDGEPSMDVWAMDIARFGEFATREYGTIKSTENYERRFLMTFPNEELPAMRRQKTTAIYDRLLQRGAVMGVSFGLENALWFADSPEEAVEEPTYRRSNAFGHVAREVKAVREGVGALEIANYSKHDFRGPGAAEFLDRVLAGRLPEEGRLTLAPMLTEKGKLYGDLTVACLADDRFYVFGSGAAQEMHRRWFEEHLPESGVTYRNRSDELHGMAISGPKSRQLLALLTRDDVSAGAFRFRDIRETTVAGVPVMIARISFSGELGYEIYCAPQFQLRLFDAIETAGADMGLILYGARTLMSLRLEKMWGVWTLDYRPDFTAAEAGLDRFIDFDKEFIGRDAALAERESGPARRLVTLVVDADGVDPIGDEAVMHDGECVGYATSGGYGHFVGESIAMAYVPAKLAKEDEAFDIEILGDMRKANVRLAPLYDADGKRMRS